MIDYAFDLYPRDDPKDGARILRFSKLQVEEYAGEANGTGSGKFVIRADDTQADSIDPRGLQYVRVIEINADSVDGTTLSGFAETVVGGFFLDKAQFKVLDENGTRRLEYGGAGVLSYLARSVMAPHTYIHDVFTGQDPFDDTWRLYAQSTVYANGNFLGAMLWRVIYEAQHYRNTATYTHRHADGLTYTDSHDDDRVAADVGIPDLTMTFDQFDDSNGNAWAVSAGDFKAQTNENVLAIVKRLMEAGLYVSMDPDSFELSAWPAASHRRTRTGAAWGANVVRFQKTTDGTIATSNIKSDLDRAITAFIKRRTMWVGGQDVYVKVTGTTDIPWEGGHYSDTADADALTAIGDTRIDALDDAGDTLQLRARPGNDPSEGLYRPFVHALLDDLCTVHVGTGQWDFDEQNFPIAKITLKRREGGDWDVWYDLGSSYAAASSRQFQVSPVAAHNHPPNPRLCDPSVACANLTAGDLTAQTATNGGVESGASTQWSGGSVSTALFHGGLQSYGETAATGEVIYTFDPSQSFTAGTRYVLETWLRFEGDFLGVSMRFGKAGVDDEVSTITGVSGADPAGTFIDEEAGADGNTWGKIRACWTPTATRTGVRVAITTTQAASTAYAVDDLALYTTSADELAGTSNKAARCDHRHRAVDVTYNPAISGLASSNVQDAIDELAAADSAADAMLEHSHPESEDAFELTADPDGGWIWYQEPRAVRYGDYTYFGYVAGDSGDVAVRAVPHDTLTPGAEIVLHAALEVDDHSNPTFLVRDSDKKLIVFYSAHNDTTLRYRISTNSITSDPTLSGGFAAEVGLDPGGSSYTYPSPIQLLGEANDPIYLFFREGANAEWWYVTTDSTTSWGTWSARTKILTESGKTPYMKCVQNGDARIDFVADDGAAVDDQTSQWHFYYEDGDWHQSDGTVFTLPADSSKMTRIYDGTTVESSHYDIAIGLDGHPRTVYVTFDTPATDHGYWYARWTGTEWVTSRICDGGGGIDATGYYSGGMAIDRAEPTIVYASREVDGEWEMFRYTSPDGGESWVADSLTEGSAERNIRPAVVYGAAPELRVLWMRGDYTGFTVWDTGTYGAGTAAIEHTHALDDLSDVTITAAATGDLLRYNGSAWVDVTDATVIQEAGHYELLMTGSSPPDPLEDGTGDDWLWVWVNS